MRQSVVLNQAQAEEQRRWQTEKALRKAEKILREANVAVTTAERLTKVAEESFASQAAEDPVEDRSQAAEESFAAQAAEEERLQAAAPAA